MPRQMLYLDRRQFFQNEADRVLPQFISEPLRRSQHHAVPIFDGKVDGFQGMLMPFTYFLFSRRVGGTNGPSRLHELLPGSTTDRVRHRSPFPLLIAH
jgi:hypothetical protein